MTWVIIQAIVFFVAALAIEKSTYWILAALSLVNIAIYPVIAADSAMLLVTYSTLDVMTAVLIIKFGDIHKSWQISLLAVAVILAFLVEKDIVSDTTVVFDWYYHAIIGITILQLAGALYGCTNRGNKNLHPTSEHWI